MTGLTTIKPGDFAEILRAPADALHPKGGRILRRRDIVKIHSVFDNTLAYEFRRQGMTKDTYDLQWLPRKDVRRHYHFRPGQEVRVVNNPNKKIHPYEDRLLVAGDIIRLSWIGLDCLDVGYVRKGQIVYFHRRYIAPLSSEFLPSLFYVL